MASDLKTELDKREEILKKREQELDMAVSKSMKIVEAQFRNIEAEKAKIKADQERLTKVQAILVAKEAELRNFAAQRPPPPPPPAPTVNTNAQLETLAVVCSQALSAKDAEINEQKRINEVQKVKLEEQDKELEGLKDKVQLLEDSVKSAPTASRKDLESMSFEKRLEAETWHLQNELRTVKAACELKEAVLMKSVKESVEAKNSIKKQLDAWAKNSRSSRGDL
jgi:hypothetical protein